MALSEDNKLLFRRYKKKTNHNKKLSGTVEKLVVCQVKHTRIHGDSPRKGRVRPLMVDSLAVRGAIDPSVS